MTFIHSEPTHTKNIAKLMKQGHEGHSRLHNLSRAVEIENNVKVFSTTSPILTLSYFFNPSTYM